MSRHAQNLRSGINILHQFVFWDMKQVPGNTSGTRVRAPLGRCLNKKRALHQRPPRQPPSPSLHHLDVDGALIGISSPEQKTNLLVRNMSVMGVIHRYTAPPSAACADTPRFSLPFPTPRCHPPTHPPAAQKRQTRKASIRSQPSRRRWFSHPTAAAMCLL